MLFWSLFVISVLGLGYASYKDLRTTEFPDWLPYSIIAAAVITRGIFSYIYSDWWIIGSSLLIGGLFLGIGLLAYHFKQWGDGDAWLLGVMGFLYPGTYAMPEAVNTLMPFPFVLIFNFLIISFFYVVAYSITLGLKNKKEVRKFFKELRKDSRSIELVTAGFTIACIVLVIYLYTNSILPPLFINQILVFPALLFSLLVFMRYGRFVENNLLKKEINVKDMKLGDVPVNSKWRVMTEKELKELKKKGGKIWIKEGVRHAPVFLLTVIVTIFYGNLFFLFV